MTDKQLACLLMQLHNQLTDVLNQLSDELKETTNLECHIVKVRGKWIAKGKPPKPGEWYITNALEQYDPNYEWLDTKGRPICLDGLNGFLDNLKDDIKALR